MRVSLLILRLREVSSLSMGNYIQFGRSHESDFHGITRFGSKICHRSVTCVTCDTHVAVCDRCPACSQSWMHPDNTYMNGKSCMGIFKSVLHLPTAEQMLMSVAQLSDSWIKLIHTSEYVIDLVNCHTEEPLTCAH